MPSDRNLEWAWLEDLSKNEERVSVGAKFVDGPLEASNCQVDSSGLFSPFNNALRNVATREELVLGGPQGYDIDSSMPLDERLTASCSEGIYPPIFHKYRSKGIYCFRFFLRHA